MPVKSFLAMPKEGRFQPMLQALAELPEIEVVAAENRELAVVAWEVENEEEDRRINEAIEAVDDLQCLALVFGHTGICV